MVLILHISTYNIFINIKNYTNGTYSTHFYIQYNQYIINMVLSLHIPKYNIILVTKINQHYPQF